MTTASAVGVGVGAGSSFPRPPRSRRPTTAAATTNSAPAPPSRAMGDSPDLRTWVPGVGTGAAAPGDREPVRVDAPVTSVAETVTVRAPPSYPGAVTVRPAKGLVSSGDAAGRSRALARIVS